MKLRPWFGFGAILASLPVFYATLGMDYIPTGPATLLGALVLLGAGGWAVLDHWFAPPSRPIDKLRPAPELAAPNAGPDMCRVCGLGDLAYWDDLDAGLESAGEDRHAVGYGSGRAHRDCAIVVPYVAPRVDPQREIVRVLQRGDRRPGWVSREHRHDPAHYSRWLPSRLAATLRAAAEAGSEEVRIEAPPDGLSPSLGDFVVTAPGASHGEIVSVFTVWMRPFDGGLVAVLRGSLRHSYPAGARLVPVAYGWGWNEGAGRPNLPHEAGYPHACECGCCGSAASESAFLASVRAACGIPCGPGDPQPSSIAAGMINAGLLSINDARRMAIESMPRLNGTLRSSVDFTIEGNRARGWMGIIR